jgi:putative AlgH/UPF0301 family transcriptional regulator
MTLPKAKRRKRNDSSLKGQLLVAMPLMSDRRFARSVIYLCAHSDDGAMGLIINHRASHISFPDLLERLGIAPRGAEDGISNDILERQVHVGGPVETGRGFVLHTSDYFANESTLQIDRDVSLTAAIDILKAIASGEGPDRAAARERDPVQRLASLPTRHGSRLRSRSRIEVHARIRQDRYRSLSPRERRRACVRRASHTGGLGLFLGRRLQGSRETRQTLRDLRRKSREVGRRIGGRRPLGGRRRGGGPRRPSTSARSQRGLRNRR